ncbi:MAG: hypothetical protein V1888_04135 [archaeon]
MVVDELFSYLNTGAMFFSFGVVSYLAAKIGVAVYSNMSEEIRTQAQLERVVSEEAEYYKDKGRKVRLVPLYSNPRLTLHDVPGLAWKLDDNTFEVSARNRYGVRHVYGGHLNCGNLSERKGFQKVIGNVLYHVYYEPVAVLAGVGIRV